MATSNTGGQIVTEFNVFGEKEFAIALDGLIVRASLASVRFVQEGALLIERQAKVNASGPKHKRGTPTKASPGSGPGIITGTLRRSIRTELGRVAGYAEAKVGPTAIYGRAVELTYNYPYLIPAAKFVQSVALPVLAARIYGEAVR